MCNDYIIANHRIRISGSMSNLTKLGLNSFEPFAVEYSEQAACDMILTMACDIAHSGVQLTRFDFAEGEAECVFLRSDEEYILTIGDGADKQHIFACKCSDTSHVRTNVGLVNVNASFLRFGIWFMYNIGLVQRMGVAVHSSAIIYNGEVVMFLGESGTGKSTHTRLWRENIDGAILLNDDSPFVGVEDGQVIVYGSPWSGKTPCYKNESYPLRALVRLSQAPYNKMERVAGIKAIGALLPSLPPAFAFDAPLEDYVMDILSAIVSQVPVYHLECLPNADAAHLAHKIVYGE